MKAFSYYNATDLKDAVMVLGNMEVQSLPLAGGTDILGEMKNRYVSPGRLVNLKSIPGLDKISFGREGLKLGALVRLHDIAMDKRIQKDYPGLAQAAESVGSPQLRNVGTLGGNLCQRPRCWYYRGEEYPCIRKSGGICYAVSGRNKYHCVIGGGPCFIVHPSDTAPMLMALGAKVTIQGVKGSRDVVMDEFFILPEEDSTRENILLPGELITAVTVPAPAKGSRNCYLKFKERGSRDFALASAGASLLVDEAGTTCLKASLVLGGVAPAPHRAKEAEALLTGKKIDLQAVEQAVKAALADAAPMTENEYKVGLARTILKRAILRAAGVEV